MCLCSPEKIFFGICLNEQGIPVPNFANEPNTEELCSCEESRASAKKFPEGANGKTRPRNSTNKPPSTLSVVD